MLFNRSLLYTAITRAEKLVVLIGRLEVLQFMVQNDYRSERYTGLAEMFDAQVQTDEGPYTYEYDEEDDRNDVEPLETGVIDWSELLDF